MTVRTKILGGFTLMVAIGVILGIVGLTAIIMLTGTSNELYTLNMENIGAADVLCAHYSWRQGLTESVLNENNFTGSVDPNTCALGKWLASDTALNIKDEQVLSLLERIKAPHAYIHTEAGYIAEFLQNGDFDAARSHLQEEVLPTTQEVITFLTEISDRYDSLIEINSVEAKNLGNKLIITIIAVIVAAAAIGVFMALSITSYTINPLKMMTNFMVRAGTEGDIELSQEDIETVGKYSVRNDELGQLIKSTANFVQHVGNTGSVLREVSDGNLTADVNILSEKDILGLSLQKMMEKLNSMFMEIDSAAVQVSSGADQIADVAQSLAQGATEQSATIDDLSVTINKISSETRSKAGNGTEKMVQMVKSVQDINEASNEIGKIIKVIEDIAFQTNILALNASVEAARAGVHGKGFAVVAEEVKNLANRSQLAARETNHLIENSLKLANEGADIANETQSALESIVETIDNLAEAVNKIGQISIVVQKNSATAQESAAASQELSGQSGMMHSLISWFKLRREELGFGMNMHGVPSLPYNAPHKM